MKPVGILMFVVGLVVAVTAAAKLPNANGSFPDTWPLAIVAAVTAIFGVVLWRIDGATQSLETAETRSRDEEPETLLCDALSLTRKLKDNLAAGDRDDLLSAIQAILSESIAPMVSRQERLISRFGMSHGAEILVTSAVGERMLNRAWSSLADGYLDEASQAIDEAESAFAKASGLLDSTNESDST